MSILKKENGDDMDGVFLKINYNRCIPVHDVTSSLDAFNCLYKLLGEKSDEMVSYDKVVQPRELCIYTIKQGSIFTALSEVGLTMLVGFVGSIASIISFFKDLVKQEAPTNNINSNNVNINSNNSVTNIINVTINNQKIDINIEDVKDVIVQLMQLIKNPDTSIEISDAKEKLIIDYEVKMRVIQNIKYWDNNHDSLLI